MRFRRASGAVALVLLAVAGFANAAQRTFVASVGNDANPCSLTLPCRGFAAAIAAVAPGGEVVALDSAGYGTFIVTKSVTVTAPAGVYAGISVFLGAGITVTTTAFDTVVLRGLTIVNQASSPPTSGILFDGGGRLIVDGLVVEGMKTYGIEITGVGATLIRNCLLSANEHGVFRLGGGTQVDIRIENTSIVDSVAAAIQAGDAQLTIENTRLLNQAVSGRYGLRLVASTPDPPLKAHVSNSVIRGYVEAIASDGYMPSSTVISGSEITQNTTAVVAWGAATIALQGNRITHNETALIADQGGTIFTAGNNYVAYNTTLQAGNGTFAPPSGSY